jgi:DNA-binding transcriptional LysR family regulator
MQLEMFIAVIEERSVQRAADRVCRTQPAVSIALRKLEDQIGTALLDRSCRRAFRLTAAGELLYEFASRMIALRNEVMSTLRGEKHGCTGRLSIGASGATSLRWVPQLTAKFRAINPIVRVEVFSDDPDKLLSEVADRKIDAAFLSAHPAHCRTKCSVVLNPLRTLGPDDSLWLALPRAGRSHTLRMFEEMISSESAISVQTARGATVKEQMLCASPARVRRRSFHRKA